jgi:hypothetical protein
MLAIFECQRHESDVHQIKPYDQQVVDGISQGGVSEKAVDEKYAAVFVKRSSDPHSECNTNGQVSKVSGHGGSGAGEGIGEEGFHIVPFVTFASFISELTEIM